MQDLSPDILPQLRVLLINENFVASTIIDATSECINLGNIASLSYDRQDHYDVQKKYDINPLEFIGNIRDVIEDFIDEFEFSSSIKVEISRLDNNAYKTDFSGIIDTANVDRQSRKVVCPLIKENDLEVLLSKIDTKVSLSFPILITLPENSIVKTSIGQLPVDSNLIFQPPFATFNAVFGNQATPLEFNLPINNFDPYQWDGVAQTFSQDSTTPLIVTGTEGITFDYETTIDFGGDLVLPNPTAPVVQLVVTLEVFEFDNLTPKSSTSLIGFFATHTGTPIPGIQYSYKFSGIILNASHIIPPNSVARITYAVSVLTFNAVGEFLFYPSSLDESKFVFIDVDKESTCNVMPVNNALTQICSNFGLGFNASGFFGLGGLGNYDALCTGYQIRQFSYPDKPIQVSFSQVFDAYFALKNVGWGFVDGNIVMEDVRYFFQDIEIAVINEPDDSFSIKTNREVMYSAVVLTAAVNDNEEINAEKQSFVFPRSWDTELDRLSNEYEIDYSGLFTDMYDVYVTKRKRELKDEDWELDKNLFGIYLNTAKDTTSGQENFSGVSNIVFPDQIINGENSPKQAVLRHLSMITSGLQKFPALLLTLTNFNRNVDFETVADAGNNFGLPAGFTVNEKNDITSTEFSEFSAFIKPFMITFTYPMNDELQNAIDLNPFGYITVIKNGVKYRGWIENIDIQDMQGSRIAEFELLEKA